MSRKKKVEIIDVIEDHSNDPKYRKLLDEHTRLVNKWSDTGRAAAAGYPTELTKKQGELYKQTVKIAEECREIFATIIAMDLQPQPVHYLMPWVPPPTE